MLIESGGHKDIGLLNDVLKLFDFSLHTRSCQNFKCLKISIEILPNNKAFLDESKNLIL